MVDPLPMRIERRQKPPEPGLPKLPDFMMGDQINQNQPIATIPKKLEVRRWLVFGWLTDAVLNSQKTLALRNWGLIEALEWKRRMYAYAYDKPPSKGGTRLALLEITHTPYQQQTNKLRKSDFFASGLAYAQAMNLTSPSGKTPGEIWEGWKENSETYWVVRFKVVQIYDTRAPKRGSISI